MIKFKEATSFSLKWKQFDRGSKMAKIIVIGIVIVLISIIFKSARRKRTPENHYRPFDNLMEGKKEDDDRIT